MQYIKVEFYEVVTTSGNLQKKKAMWILLGDDTQTEETALLLHMHITHFTECQLEIFRQSIVK